MPGFILLGIKAMAPEPKNIHWKRFVQIIFFVANTFQIQPFHEGIEKQADVAFCFMPGA
jgi:hypothetical protein